MRQNVVLASKSTAQTDPRSNAVEVLKDFSRTSLTEQNEKKLKKKIRSQSPIHYLYLDLFLFREISLFYDILVTRAQPLISSCLPSLFDDAEHYTMFVSAIESKKGQVERESGKTISHRMHYCLA